MTGEVHELRRTSAKARRRTTVSDLAGSRRALMYT
jgi:hypothetical protein